MLKGLKAVNMLKEAAKACTSIVEATKHPDCVIKQMARSGEFDKQKEQKPCH